MALLLRCIALFCIGLPGTVYISAFLRFLPPLFFSCSFSVLYFLLRGFFVWVALLGSSALFSALAPLVKTLFLSSFSAIYSHHDAFEIEVWFSPQDPQVQL